MRDVSEYKRMAEELDAVRQDAVSAREARAGLLAILARYLRASLNAVIGYSQILAGRGGPSLAGRRQHYAEVIRESGGQMLKAVDAARDLASLEVGRYYLRFDEIDMAEIVRECCDAMALPAKRAGIGLSHGLAPGDRE